MPRTVVPVTSLAMETAIAPPTGTAVDPTNGHYVDWGGDQDRLLFILRNTATAAKNFTIKGGDPDLALSNVQATDLVIAVPSAAERWVRLSSRRFQQTGAGGDPGYGGQVMIDVEAAATGTIAVLRQPPG